MTNKRTVTRKQLRSLTQYKDLTNEEFEKIWEQKAHGIQTTEEFETRIQKKIEEFGEDYDLNDLKANDKLTLRSLAQSYLTLEDLEALQYNMRSDGLEDLNVAVFKNVRDMISTINSDISKMQNDLNITRKIRKSDSEESVISYLDDLKKKAKEFYEAKMSYIVCPECNMLLSTAWFLYPDANNEISLTCNRKIGEITCGHKFKVSTKELKLKRGTNKPEVLPESML